MVEGDPQERSAGAAGPDTPSAAERARGTGNDLCPASLARSWGPQPPARGRPPPGPWLGCGGTINLNGAHYTSSQTVPEQFPVSSGCCPAWC